MGFFPLIASALPIVVDPTTPLTGNYAVEWNGSSAASWTTSNVTLATVSGGFLSGTTSSTDAQITRTIPNNRPDLDLGFNDFLEIRMRVPANYADNIDIYYGTTATTGFSGARILVIPNARIPKDGAFHTYRIDVGPEPWWRASLSDLRIDPGNASGVPFATVSLPLKKYGHSAIRVNGMPLWLNGKPNGEIPGITPDGEADGWIRFTVAPGIWIFETR